MTRKFVFFSIGPFTVSLHLSQIIYYNYNVITRFAVIISLHACSIWNTLHLQIYFLFENISGATGSLTLATNFRRKNKVYNFFL